MNLITGRTGTDHVLARHDAIIHRTLIGDGDYILHYGNNMSYSPKDGDEIYINDGALIMQGRLCEIVGRDEVAVAVCSASSLKRKAVIVAEYRIDNLGIESVNLVALNGEESSNVYIEPEIPYLNGNIDAGEVHQMPLYSVEVDGFAINKVTALFMPMAVPPLTTAMEYATNFATNLKDNVSETVTQINTIITDMQGDVDERLDEMSDDLEQEINDIKARATGTIPIITASTRAPLPEEGEDGEFWVVYSAQ